jgi:hypothetical protein
MRKLSLSNLRQRFHYPLRLEKIQVAPILEAEAVKPAKPETNFQIQPKPSSPVQEDGYSTYHIQVQLTKYTHRENANHEVLQMGFCCQRCNNSKLVAVNHTTELFNCFSDKCQQKLIKVKIGEWS